MARETRISRIAGFSGVGVWSDFRANHGNVDFAPKSVVYGYNGSGKTTLSRIFTSLEHGTISPKLGDHAKFRIHFSDDSSASESDLTNPLGKHLLVFNTDFIEENLRWDSSTAEPIFYLDQSNIGLVDELRAAEEKRASLSDRLAEAEKTRESSNKELKDKRTAIGKAVREAWGNGYTQAFNARNVQREYQGNGFGEECQISEEGMIPLRETIRQPEPLPKLGYSHQLPPEVGEWLEEWKSLIGQRFTAKVLNDLRQHPDMLSWVASGHRYHAGQKLETCLLCGHTIESSRQETLEGLFGESWEAQEAQVHRALDQCASLRQKLSAAIQDMPRNTAIQPKLRERYDRVKEDLAAELIGFESAISSAQGQLELRRDGPLATLVVPDSMSLLSKERLRLVRSLQRELLDLLKEHDDSYDDFDAHRLDAITKIKGNLLFEHQDEYRHLEGAVRAADQMEAELLPQLSRQSARCEQLSDQLKQHGAAAGQLSDLVGEYLGHKSIRLRAKDQGYQVIRSDGQTAEHLSEGEKTAIAFCFFLTQFEAEGRDRKKLVVVVDDPVSSLDSTAQSFAFGLLKKYTKRVAQVILLTHNLQLMHMAKRQFFQGHRYEEEGIPQGLLQIDCTERSDGKRQSQLRVMHSLLARFDTEYQYLFHLVEEADQTKNSPFIFLLPNAMRKLLEIFSAFAAPDKVGFAQALQDSASDLKQIDSAEMTAMERLCQIESHGDIEDVTTLSPMTIEESYRAARGALKYIRARDKRHFAAMKALIQRVGE